jgi:outer membrane protein OmpA-like peptidoglycan-associated protein
MLVPALAWAQNEPGQDVGAPIVETAPGKTVTVTRPGETTTTKVEPGQITATKRDAAGRTATETVATQPGEKTTVVTTTVAPAPVPKVVPIYFETGSDKIEPISFALIDATAASIKSNPRIQVVAVEGHADDRGDQAYNRDLTERRAHAVSQALQERGVAPDHLQSRGYGDTKPICSANDEDCWSQNRRVDIVPRAAGDAEPNQPAP